MQRTVYIFLKNITNGEEAGCVERYIFVYEYQVTARLMKSYRKFIGEIDEGICDEFGEVTEHLHGITEC